MRRKYFFKYAAKPNLPWEGRCLFLSGFTISIKKPVINEGGEDFVACFEGAGERAGDFGGADALAIADRHFADRDSLFRCFQLHLDCPSEGFVLHVQRKQLWVSDGSEGA